MFKKSEKKIIIPSESKSKLVDNITLLQNQINDEINHLINEAKSNKGNSEATNKILSKRTTYFVLQKSIELLKDDRNLIIHDNWKNLYKTIR